jgi:hypothetical protein
LAVRLSSYHRQIQVIERSDGSHLVAKSLGDTNQ